MAYEFCEDSAKQGIVYSEVRYCPHVLANKLSNAEEPAYTKPGTLTTEDVMSIICDSLDRGQKDFGIKVRSILCCMRHKPGILFIFIIIHIQMSLLLIFNSADLSVS